MNTITVSRDKNLRMLVNLLIVYSYIIIAFLMSYFLTNQHIKTSLFYSAVVLLAVTFSSLAEHTKNTLLYQIFMFFSFFVLFFIFGFRDFSAIDDSSYIRIFNQVSMIGWFEYFKSSTMEPGYLILNSIVSSFTENYLYMQLIASLIPLLLFYYGFNKYKEIISLPTAVFLLCSMLYFQMLSVGLIRMFIAIAIVFVALRYITEHKPFKYAIFIVLATMFHYSAFFLVFLVYFAINKNNLARGVARFYTLTFLVSPVLFVLIARFLVPLLGSRYSNYGLIDSINLNASTFTTLPLIFLLLLFYKKFNDNEQLYFKVFVFVYSLSLIIGIFGDMINLGRLVFYSYSAFILSASMVSKKIRFNSNKILFMAIIVLYGFIYVFYTQFTFEPHIPNLYPYKNFFFNI